MAITRRPIKLVSMHAKPNETRVGLDQREEALHCAKLWQNRRCRLFDDKIGSLCEEYKAKQYGSPCEHVAVADGGERSVPTDVVVATLRFAPGHPDPAVAAQARGCTEL